MMKLNNKKLTIVLAVLVIVYLGARFFRASKRENTLNIELAAIDTASVQQIKLYPVSEQRQEVVLSRTSQGWVVSREGMSDRADSNAVKALMGSFVNMRANRIVTGQSSKWDEYHVGDTSGIRIVVLGDGDIRLGEWWLGDAPAQGNPYGGGQSYLRLADADKVYAVDGYLYSQYNKPLNDWRDKTFLRVTKDDVMSITASGVSAWSLTKEGTSWLLDGATADSAAVERYINRMALMSLPTFANGFEPKDGADALLTVHGRSGELVSVQAWKQDTAQWIVQSSQRPTTYFLVDDKKFADEVIPLKSSLDGR